MRTSLVVAVSLLSFASSALSLTACGGNASGPSSVNEDDDGGHGGTVLPDAGKVDSAKADTGSHPTTDDAGASSHSDAQAEGGDTTTSLASAPEDTWTWIPIADSHCGNGSTTGIGINPHAGATQLLFFLQGGGACTDADSCWGASPTASNMTGYGATEFAADPVPTYGVIFQRGVAGNPFSDATLVFVPYCTGDLHVGTGTPSYSVNGVATPTYFHGASNVDTFAKTVAANYPGLSRVFLTGISAGGFGTFLNQDAVAHAFGNVRVDVIDDSGPVLQNAAFPADWSARFPAACSSCVDASSVFAYTRQTYPTSRYGFLTFQTDTTLPEFFGQTDAAFAMLIQDFVTSLASDPNTASFVDQSSGHVVMAETDATAAPFILPWLTQLATDDPAWASVQH